MVSSPFHLAPAWIVYRVSRVKLCLPALIIGSVIPDIEFIVGFIMSGSSGRLVLHSIIGAATIGTLLSVPVTVYLYPLLVKWVFKTRVDMSQYSLSLLSISAFIGTMLHILVDSFHHEYNPLLYPFTNASIDALVIFGDWRTASILVESFFGILFIAILTQTYMSHRDTFWSRLLSG